MNKIELKIKEVIKSIAADMPSSGASRTDWTNEVMSRLCAVGNDYFEYYVCTKPNRHDGATSQFLYDMFWYKPLDGIAEEEISLDAVMLALECEWSRKESDIRFDFFKLVQSRAKNRVMIFDASTIEEVRDIFAQFKNIVRWSRVSVPGDRYLFIGWDDNEGFSFDSFIKE